jgi:hypothetical protein
LPVNRGFFVLEKRALGRQERKGKKMNKNKYRRVPTQFGPETQFVVNPSPATPFRLIQENEFERLKKRLLFERLFELENSDSNNYLRRAANEAAAVAWLTPYPLLVFPELFEEKAHLALLQAERQAAMRQRSRELLTTV